ncbi:Cytoplasmic GTPase/eEF2-like protein (ribosomal biogenesis) [Entophlyctis luteolus]|nr:Cytoplasmic GTPase/eEF2-like protein (ribosomal biogenesis) [Entophlyctis luteolus]
MAARLVALQKQTTRIRNICILAHVDHGKTTLTDSLIASNGIISSKLAGSVRYLDSRDDEIERGITMKSSGISLLFHTKPNPANPAGEDILVNLIDSPGHIDFASEVSTASRLCDGCLVLVDAVEGVCTQTHSVLRQALNEQIKPILVINKIDRLITQLKMSPYEAYSHMSMILEEVNSIVGTFHMENLIADDSRAYLQAVEAESSTATDAARAVDDWILEDRDDEHLYFSPEKGNVVFASAIDGWAFQIDHFAALYASKLGVKESALMKVLWGDYYFDPKTKRAVGPKGLKGRALKPFFVQFILENLWSVYDAVEKDRAKLEKIVQVLNLKVLPRDLKAKDPKPVLQTVMHQWLPLANAILNAIANIVPSPLEASRNRLPNLLASLPPVVSNQPKNAYSQEEDAMIACDTSSPHVVAFVSKMFSVPADTLQSNAKKSVGVPGSTSDRVQLSSEEEREKRRLAMLAERAERRRREQDGHQSHNSPVTAQEERPVAVTADKLQRMASAALSDSGSENAQSTNEPEILIGFARCYSGTIRIGQKLHVLGPKYHPSKPRLHHSEFTVSKLYMMMGRELFEIEEVPAGNVFGIGGLDGHVLKSATLSSSLNVRNFGKVHGEAPILRVALEPMNPSEMNKLVDGLQLLNQADPCVEVFLQETGEHVIVTAGALHLERCLKDLRERFARIEIQVSEPIVPFRETISTAPAITKPDEEESDSEEHVKLPTGTVILSTPNNVATFRIRAVPLPKNVLDFLNQSSERLKEFAEANDQGSDANINERLKYVGELELRFEEAKKEGKLVEKDVWTNMSRRILEFGPKEIGPNILVCGESFEDQFQPWVGKTETGTKSPVIMADDVLNNLNGEDETSSRRILALADYEGSVSLGFQMATFAGPLCNEPMMGVGFILENFKLDQELAESRQIGLLPGQIMATFREGCRQAFLKWSPRMALAMYSSEMLGKVYAVLNRRRGRILSEEIKEGTPFFQIKSLLPVIESFGFSDDIRKKTSGTASPQLIFSGFEVLDIDPFWVPTTQEELEDLGEKADRENIAKKYMEGVRQRKGMFVERKIVEHAEKQRTLKQK